MKLKSLILIAAAFTVLAASACGKESLQQTESAGGTELSEPEYGTFDIEYVRKQINLKGHPFEIPMALKDLPECWTWKEHENSHYSADGSGLAYVYYNGEEMVIAGLENYFEGSENDGIIYNLTIETDDCSIDSLIPLKSTKQDVIDRYGEPDEITKSGYYSYGTTNNDDKFAGRINEQCVIICFDENEVITEISLTYADLTKEKY